MAATEKPTYEELEARVRELETEALELKRTQEALRESEEKYRNVVERSNDGIVIIQDGRIKYANPSLARMTGYDPSEAIDSSFTDYIDPDEVDEAIEYYRRRMAGEPVPARYERGLRRKDGTIIATEVDGSLIMYHDKPANIVIIRDITERKQAEDALKRSAEQTKLMASSISHDLKSAAVGIYGMTKRLHGQYRDILQEKGKGYCDQILEAAEHIAALVANINIFISTREMPLNIQNVSLKEVLQMIRDEFSTRLDIRQVRWVEPAGRPEIRCDRLSLVRILRNLVDNALKYGGDDLKEIKIDCVRTDEFDTLSVINDGVALKPGAARKIFQPFQRDEGSKNIRGMGLGLAIVKDLAEQHDGKAWVEAFPEKGTAFYVSLSRRL